MVRACIFDLDGTLLDTLQDLTNSVNAALAACDFPQRSLDEVRAFVGNGVRRLMRRAVPDGTSDADYEKAYAYFLDVYEREKAHYTRPYAGVIDTVQALQARGIRCAVLSNKNDDAVRALCAQYFPEVFEMTQGLCQGIAAKPAPDALFKICERLGIAIDDAVYVGDSEVDVATAEAAGMRLIAVTWGFRSREALIEAGAHTLIDTPKDLLRLL